MVGDSFTSTTIRTHFLDKEPDNQWFMKTHFQIEKYCDSKYSNKNKNILARIQNTIGKAFDSESSKFLLPDVILIVLHRDIINVAESTTDDEERIVKKMGEWMEWIFAEVDDMLTKRLGQLPDRAIPEVEPVVYFSTIPQSKYFSYDQRVVHAKFNRVLENVAKLYPRIRLIWLKNWWDIENKALITGTGSTKLSDLGIDALWRAIDASVEFNVNKRKEFTIRDQAMKLDKKKPKIKKSHDDKVRDADLKMSQFFNKKKTQFERYHWSRKHDRCIEDYRKIVTDKYPRFLLPRPR